MTTEANPRTVPVFIEGDGEYKKELKRKDRSPSLIEEDGRDPIHPLRAAEVFDRLMSNPRF